VRRCFVLLSLLPVFVPATAAPEDPAVLQIRIVEGEGTVYALGSRATRGITVEITDETGKPVGGAAVSFQLPADGPGGVFSNGSRSDIVTTRADGAASVWGMQWNRSAGSFEVRITAVKGAARAGTMCPQYLSAGKVESAGGGSRIGHKWLWIGVAVGAGVGAGAVIAGRAGKPASGPTAETSAIIGSPTIALGHP